MKSPRKAGTPTSTHSARPLPSEASESPPEGETTLIQPPRLRARERGDDQRHATWLELFHDLIFAVAVLQLANKLASGINGPGTLAFAALFVPIWWAWIGSTFYTNRFVGDEDLLQRLLTMLQMLIAAALALNVRDAFGTTGIGFALSYAALRLVLVISYIRAGRHIHEARSLTDRFRRGFGLAALIWLLSMFVPAPARFVLWTAGLAVDFGTPLFAGRLHTDLAPDDLHLPERFGQFTLIVIGQAVALAVISAGRHALTPGPAIAATLALTIACSLAWIYFDNLDGSAIRTARAQGHTAVYQVWLYAHLPLVIGLTATGVGVESLLNRQPGVETPDALRWLVCGGCAASLIALAVIHQASASPPGNRSDRVRASARTITGFAVALFALIGRGTSPLVIIGVLAASCALQVAIDLRVLGGIAVRDEEQ